MEVEKPVRTRRSHAKVRSGCRTCKARRKKCDEGRPDCYRCKSTGRVCGGYLDADPGASFSLVVEDSPQSTSSLTVSAHNGLFTRRSSPSSDNSWTSVSSSGLQAYPAPTLFATERDNFCFNVVLFKVGPELSGYFDSSFWQGFLFRTCFAHPTIRQAAVALGAVHRRHELGITPEAFEYCDFSQKAYIKALKFLKEALDDDLPNAAETAMITHLLLAAFEVYQGNDHTALAHVTQGLQVAFSRAPTKVLVESQSTIVPLTQANMRNLISTLEDVAGALFERPPIVLVDPATGSDPPEVAPSFNTLGEAYDSIFTQVRWLMHAMDQQGPGYAGVIDGYQNHINELQRWSFIYVQLSMNARSSKVQERPFRFLRIYREAAYLLVLIHLVENDFDARDLHANAYFSSTFASKAKGKYLETMQLHFSKLLMLAGNLLDYPTFLSGVCPGKMNSFSVDNGMVLPMDLEMAVNRAWDPQTRSPPSMLADFTPDHVRSRLGTYSVGEKLVAMEEQAVLACGALPKDVDAKWVDVTSFLEERKVALRYCTADKETGRLTWTQEWATF